MLDKYKNFAKAFDAIANTYLSLCYIDISSCTFEEIHSMEYVRNAIGERGNAQEALDTVVLKGFVIDQYVNRMLDFTDLKTLEMRLEGKRIISQEFKGTNRGWCRSSFIPVEYDENHNLKSVLYAVQEIQGEVLSLRDKLDIEETLLECVMSLSKNPETAASINQLLLNIANYHHADRAYVFEFDFEKGLTSNTYEWCQKGVTPKIQNLQNLKMKDIQYLIDMVRKGVLNFPDINFFSKDSNEYRGCFHKLIM